MHRYIGARHDGSLRARRHCEHGGERASRDHEFLHERLLYEPNYIDARAGHVQCCIPNGDQLGGAAAQVAWETPLVSAIAHGQANYPNGPLTSILVAVMRAISIAVFGMFAVSSIAPLESQQPPATRGTIPY